MKYTAVTIPVDHGKGTLQWCRDTFGRPKGADGTLKWHEMTWYCRPDYKTNQVKYYFREPKHAAWFALRWA